VIGNPALNCAIPATVTTMIYCKPVVPDATGKINYKSNYEVRHLAHDSPSLNDCCLLILMLV